MDMEKNNKRTSVVAHMIRTITVVSACLLTTIIVHAEDMEPDVLGLGIRPYELGFQHQHFHRVDMNMSPQEYKALYSHNRRLVQNNLKSYSKDALELIGIPEQVGYRVGAALDLVINDGAALNLNNSKTLAVEFRNASKPGRALYFRIKLDW